MQFKLDENLPPAAADLLRDLGHDVMTVYDQGLQSCTDPEVLAACQGKGKVLLSLDLDFSNILVYPPERYAGLIVLRLHKPGPKAVLSLLRLSCLTSKQSPLPAGFGSRMSTEFAFGRLAKSIWGRKSARSRSHEHLVRFTPGSPPAVGGLQPRRHGSARRRPLARRKAVA